MTGRGCSSEGVSLKLRDCPPGQAGRDTRRLHSAFHSADRTELYRARYLCRREKNRQIRRSLGQGHVAGFSSPLFRVSWPIKPADCPPRHREPRGGTQNPKHPVGHLYVLVCHDWVLRVCTGTLTMARFEVFKSELAPSLLCWAAALPVCGVRVWNVPQAGSHGYL